jgi:uncharacterized protein YabE (DUF348 family)
MYKNIIALFSSFTRKKLSLSVAALMVLAVTTGFVGYNTTKSEVSLMLNGKKTEVNTHADTVRELLSENHINPNKHDLVRPGLNAKVKDNMKIDYVKANKVVLNVDGKKKSVWTTAKTVEQFVKEQQLTLNDHDVIKPGLTAKIHSKYGPLRLPSLTF